jgi:DNA-directed RNA polymerase specialized sigma24 family protein
MNNDSTKPSDRFPSTHWSKIVDAGQAQGDERREVLEAMLQRYLPALRSHLIYGRRVRPDTCEDVLQAFVTEKILSRNLIAEARRERGRFRSFLMVTLDRFMFNYLRTERNRSKHVEGYEDIDVVAPVDASIPSTTFDIGWARELLSETLALTEQECLAKNRAAVWGIFRSRTLLPILENEKPVPYEELVKDLGFLSPSQASNALVTANRMFARNLRGIIQRYVTTEEEVQEEIRQLYTILSAAGAGSGSVGCSNSTMETPHP